MSSPRVWACMPDLLSRRPGRSRSTQVSDHDGVTLGLGVLSRWPITSMQQAAMPARHRSWVPLALTATLAHPAGPLAADCGELLGVRGCVQR